MHAVRSDAEGAPKHVSKKRDAMTHKRLYRVAHESDEQVVERCCAHELKVLRVTDNKNIECLGEVRFDRDIYSFRTGQANLLQYITRGKNVSTLYLTL